jgi:hypothetical protein
MPRDDIAWVRKNAEGEKLQVYAHQVGTRWDFFSRPGRHDDWQPLLSPPLDDWLELLDAVERRTQRRLYEPGESDKLKQVIRKRFPTASFD